MAEPRRLLAPAKLTLSLRVTGRRADGYHELSSEMVSIDLCDELLIDAEGEGLEVVCVNPSLLLGPGDLRGSSTDEVRLFLERRIPAVPPGGVSFVDARDAAEGMVLAMDKGTPGARYLLGACNLTVRELFARLSRLSGVRAPWLPVPRSPELVRMGAKLLDGSLVPFLDVGMDPVGVELAQYYWYLDASLAERDLGWTPRDPSQTLADTIEDLRARRVVWWSQASPSRQRAGGNVRTRSLSCSD